ncbi:MAG: hypothetical protein ACJAQ9_001257 [Ilumatobacter sp.]|jgi:hypothetical protein
MGSGPFRNSVLNPVLNPVHHPALNPSLNPVHHLEDPAELPLQR